MIQLSIIIPCKNEEDYISLCLESVLKQGIENEIEVIIVDNGSNDNTLRILKGYKKKIHLLEFHGETIAAVRNHGASASKGEWLAFIDADVELSEGWYRSLKKCLEKRKIEGISHENIVTGSTCTIPPNSHWMESTWFGQLKARDLLNNRYINSGHLIVHRNLFKKIGGFNPLFKTGEDEKFCDDARLAGGVILKDPTLRAIHHGYPKTIGSFFLREKWHGLGMKKHINRPWRYRDLQLAFFFWFLFIIFMVLLVWGKLNFLSCMLIFALLIGPLFILSLRRTGFHLKKGILLTLLFIVYASAKAFALGSILFRREGKLLSFSQIQNRIV